ncbi:MAG: chlorophyll A-B-binding protein [Pseudanabaena sp.]
MTEEPKVRTAFTKDERGILNNWAIEPKMYFDDKAEKNSDNQVNKQTGKMPKGRLAMIGITLLVLAMIGTTLIYIA